MGQLCRDSRELCPLAARYALPPCQARLLQGAVAGVRAGAQPLCICTPVPATLLTGAWDRAPATRHLPGAASFPQPLLPSRLSSAPPVPPRGSCWEVEAAPSVPDPQLRVRWPAAWDHSCTRQPRVPLAPTCWHSWPQSSVATAQGKVLASARQGMKAAVPGAQQLCPAPYLLWHQGDAEHPGPAQLFYPRGAAVRRSPLRAPVL